MGEKHDQPKQNCDPVLGLVGNCVIFLQRRSVEHIALKPNIAAEAASVCASKWYTDQRATQKARRSRSRPLVRQTSDLAKVL
jgi:hypothetical protein